MNATRLRAQLAAAVLGQLGEVLLHSVVVCDAKPEIVTGPTVIVHWTRSIRTREHWVHDFELIVVGFETTGTGDRDLRERIVRRVAMIVETGELTTWPTIDPHTEITVGAQTVQAATITTSITEPPNL